MKGPQSKTVWIIILIVGLVLLIALIINAYQSGRRDAARERERRAGQNAR